MGDNLVGAFPLKKECKAPPILTWSYNDQRLCLFLGD